MRYFIRLAYNGAPFCGWQIQPNSPSIQEELERALSLLLHDTITVVGCGRTDTGVHARNFYAHFDTEIKLNNTDLKQLTYKLNRFLAKEIAIFEIFPVANDFHARFSALERTYRYYISRKKDPFNQPYTYTLTLPINVKLMNIAAEYLLDVKDFTSFSKLHTQTHTNFCDVTSAFWKEQDNLLIFEISANRFLRNMVRAIVGTLLEVGMGKISLTQFQDIIAAHNRSKAGTSVPAHALFLENVRYNFNTNPIENL